MTKEWKCKDCVCYDTDACHYPSQLAEYKACEHLVVDHNYAYQQGREDVLAEILKLPRFNHYDMYNELMYQSIRVYDIERLRKPREDSQETEPDNVILQDFFKGDSQ